jgi:hypothetical protein
LRSNGANEHIKIRGNLRGALTPFFFDYSITNIDYSEKSNSINKASKGRESFLMIQNKARKASKK